jgi:hypothetical protein|tara:strand:- start:507 stop:986 length:480 start_codon:yes stop_codon:yes gene_type:complete
MEEVTPLIIGISSSLVATFIFLFSRWILLEVLIPWYLDKIYKGIRVDGQWTDVMEGEEDCPVRAALNLKQNANKITGIYSHIFLKEVDSTTTYKVEGEIRDSYVTLTCWPLAKDHLDAGTMLFKVFSRSGLRMKGSNAYISSEEGVVKSGEKEFRKIDS